MTMRFSSSQPTSSAEVLRILSSTGFIADFAKEIGDLPHRSAVKKSGETMHITIDLNVSTKGIPGVFRSLVGHEVEVRIERTFAPAGPDSYNGTLAVAARANSRDATIAGTILLGGTRAATTLAYEGKAKFSAPIIGGKVRDAIEDLAEGVLRDEAIVLSRWLNGEAQG